MNAAQGGAAILAVVLVAAVLVARRWPRFLMPMWLVARAGQIGLVGLSAIAACGGLDGVVAALVAAAVSSTAALALSRRRHPGASVTPDLLWWFGVSAVTGLLVAAVWWAPVAKGWLSLLVALTAGAGLVVELMAGLGGSGRRGPRALSPGVSFATLGIATTAAALIAGVPPVGWWFAPLALAPLLNIAAALQGRHRALAVAQETVTALSRLPDVGGYTRDGHGQRVAEVAVGIAASLGLSDVERDQLRRAGLIHDVGLVSLNTRITDGSTSLLAPLDQQRIAARSAEIAAEMPEDAPVIDALRHQAHPFIDHVTYRADVPRAARILKVANAVDDYTGGRRTPEALKRAMSRISMQQGYEFDPEVVAIARRVVRGLREG